MDRRLRQFLAVAETGNVSAAAEILHVTQPTISVNLSKLEDEHGVKLFERSSRGMTLTDFGEVLYEHAKVMARVGDHANAEIRLLKASQEKSVRIGTGFTWWNLFVKDLVADFWGASPSSRCCDCGPYSGHSLRQRGGRDSELVICGTKPTFPSAWPAAACVVLNW